MPLIRTTDASTHSSRGRDAGPSRSAPAKRQESHLPVLLLIIVLASLATALCYRVFLGKYDAGMHAGVVQQLQRLFPDAVVQVGRVGSDGPGKIIVNNVRMAARGDRSKHPLLTIHRAVLQGDLDISNWAQQTLRVEQVQLHGVRLDAWPEADGRWSVQYLTPHPVAHSQQPTIAFHDVTVRLFSEPSPQANMISIHDIHGQLTPLPGNSASPAKKPLASPDTEQPSGQHPTHFQFTCRSTGLVKKVEVEGQLDPASNSWVASGVVEKLNFSPKLLDSLPTQLSQYFSQLSGLECQASSHFKISSAPAHPVSFEIQGKLVEGRLRDPRLPYPLEELRSDFFCNNGMLQVRAMQAKSGGAELEFSSDILGFGPDVPMVIHAQAKNLELDSRLYESLPEDLQEPWNRLQPSGHVSGSLRLTYDGLRWTPIVSLHCQDVALKPWLFPYPLSNVQGLVRYQEGTFSSEGLTGLAGGQAVGCGFSLSRSGSQWYGKLSCQSAGPIGIDEQLIAALTPVGQSTSGVEQFIRSLHPRGSIELTRAVFERESPKDPRWHRALDANIYGGSINYDGFRYPIYDIRGRIAGQDDSWWLHQFEGRNDSGRILCSGDWQAVEEDSLPFDLRFEAFAVPAEEELRLALPADAQFIWNELQPTGSIDRVQVHLARRAGETVSTRVSIEEESNTNPTEGRSLRIQPKSFPLPLTDIDCRISYEPRRVLIHSASGVNGDSRLSIRGECQPQAGGRWQANVEWQPRTRLIVDSQLLKAIPKSVRESLAKIDFRGPVSILGQSQILFPNQASADPSTAWDCQLDIENGQLGDGKGIGALRGTVWTQGFSDGTNLNAAGSIAMDALTVQGLPVTRLRGPFAVRDSTLLFGSKVQEELGLPPTPETSTTGNLNSGNELSGDSGQLTADALTGKLTLSGLGRLDTGKFFLTAKLQDAELNTLLRDVGVDRASTQALCNADLQFSGIPWNSQTWNGEGDIHLANARL
ncbi:MAG: hypothetical protein KDA45_07445, partial [Planctomycetales bacterium]|nr:hypothetical protein [Planctomycetales bacterium]